MLIRSNVTRGGALIACGALLAYVTPAVAQDDPIFAVPQIEVTLTPVQGTGIELDRVPSNIQVLTQDDIDEVQPLALSDMLNKRIGSVTAIDAQNNPWQPDVSYRGFTVSPLLGLPQGLAMYQNGSRVNEPFGDVVQFDLIPEWAIENVQLVPGSNPVYGLNALGGAIALDMKDGFSFEGTEVEAYGGSNNRFQGTYQFGGAIDNVGVYIGATGFTEDGWRDFSNSDVLQLFSDLSLRGENVTIGANVTLADTDLRGNGAAPIELLNARRESIFTYPDITENQLAFGQVRGDVAVSDTVSMQGNAYYRRLVRDTTNGDETDIDECDAVPGFLCEEDGEGDVVETLRGSSVEEDDVGEEPFGVFNRSRTETEGFGGSLQATMEDDLFGYGNILVAGVSIDRGETEFGNSTELGQLTPDRTVTTTGLFVAGDEFNTSIEAENTYYGIYVTDTLALTDRLDVTLSGRFNHANIEITDKLGTALNGDHSYSRFNPAGGATYKLMDNVTVFGSYSEANRVPTAAELACADPTQPCRFPNAFVADPPLDDVVSRTIEAGARGQFALADGAAPVGWSVAPFVTFNEDDIIFVSSGPVVGSGFFQNAGNTRRVGVEVGLDGSFGRLGWFANYAFVQATFEDHLTILSENNPSANADGEIQVSPGDRIPGIPQHLAKIGVNYQILDNWDVGIDSIISSDRVFRGDEGNDQPTVEGFAIFNLSSTLQVAEGAEIFFAIENLFDTDYETFGAFGETEELALAEAPGASDPRFLGPGAPRTFRLGGRIRF